MWKKLKDLQVNFSLFAFLGFVIKVLVVNASFADSIIVLGLGSLYGYMQYLKRFQPYKLDDAIVKDLLEVKGALSKMNMVKVVEKTADKRYF